MDLLGTVFIVVIALAAGYFPATRLLMRRALQRGTMPNAAATIFIADYLARLFASTSALGQSIDMNSYWSGKGFLRDSKYFLQQQMVEQRLISLASRKGGDPGVVDTLLWSFGFPARCVCLTEREYLAMVHGGGGSVVVHGDNPGIIQTGGTMQHSYAGVGNSFHIQEMTEEFISQLIAALTDDARTTSGTTSEQAKMAAKLESALERGNKRKMLEIVNIVAALASSALTGWASTVTLLHS